MQSNELSISLSTLELILISILIVIILIYVYRKFVQKNFTSFTKGRDRSKIKKMSDSYKEAILLIDKDRKVLYSNTSAAEILGLKGDFGKKELENNKIIKLSDGDLANIFDLIDLHCRDLDSSGEYTIRAELKKDNKTIPVKIFFGIASKVKSICIVSIMDLNTEIELSNCRKKDMLTSLPNQNMAVNDIGMMVSKMQAQGKSFALILISIDNFTEIRAMLGYHQTDNLVDRIAGELRHIAETMNGRLYHMMRNNFLLAVNDVDSAKKAKDLMVDIKSKLESAFDYSNSRVPLTFSAGISLFPVGGNSVDMLIDSAYKALSEAKEKGSGYIIVDEDGLFFRDKQYETEIYTDIKSGLKNGEFELYYQPLVSMENDLVIGAEALIRWNHPKRGLVAPYAFIPVAEKTGLIVDIDRFVIDEAIKQQKRWEIFKFRNIMVSINLTLRDMESQDLVEYISDTLSRHQISPGSVKFEITENIAMVNAEETKKEFGKLKKLGVHLALDDFGTGYSSFAYLKDFSLDTLKIDRTFITDMVSNKEHQKIVQAMIGLAHNFDLQVTAEGIEDEMTYEMLKDMGCDIAQGYYFSKPLPVFEFQKMIRRAAYETESDKE